MIAPHPPVLALGCPVLGVRVCPLCPQAHAWLSPGRGHRLSCGTVPFPPEVLRWPGGLPARALCPMPQCTPANAPGTKVGHGANALQGCLGHCKLAMVQTLCKDALDVVHVFATSWVCNVFRCPHRLHLFCHEEVGEWVLVVWHSLAVGQVFPFKLLKMKYIGVECKKQTMGEFCMLYEKLEAHERAHTEIILQKKKAHNQQELLWLLLIFHQMQHKAMPAHTPTGKMGFALDCRCFLANTPVHAPFPNCSACRHQ